MNILMVCTKYSLSTDSKYLTNDLAVALVNEGHSVDVICTGDVERTESATIEGVRVWSMRAQGKGGAKYASTWTRSVAQHVRVARQAGGIDLVILFGPLVTTAPHVLLTRLHKPKHVVTIVFDIFPKHQVQLGMFPVKAESLLRWAESRLLNMCDTVTGMTQSNVDYMEDYYRLPESKLATMNVWTGKAGIAKPKEAYGSAIVFGGQLVAGRDIEFAIDFLGKCRSHNPDITLHIHSWGEEYDRIKEKYASSDWIYCKGKISRDRYVDEIAKYDAGLIVTDPNVEISTFPSKAMDYLGSGLRLLCFVEEQNDLESVIDDSNVLFTNHFDNSEPQVKKLSKFLLEADPASGRRALSAHGTFDVRETVNRITTLVTRNA